MDPDDAWAAKARNLLKAELKRRAVSYQDLSGRLAAMGVNETPASIANKVSRGRFTAAFMLQSLEAIGCQTVRLGE